MRYRRLLEICLQFLHFALCRGDGFVDLLPPLEKTRTRKLINNLGRAFQTKVLQLSLPFHARRLRCGTCPAPAPRVPPFPGIFDSCGDPVGPTDPGLSDHDLSSHHLPTLDLDLPTLKVNTFCYASFQILPLKKRGNFLTIFSSVSKGGIWVIGHTN